jgi:hypothetical protein
MRLCAADRTSKYLPCDLLMLTKSKRRILCAKENYQQFWKFSLTQSGILRNFTSTSTRDFGQLTKEAKLRRLARVVSREAGVPRRPSRYKRTAKATFQDYGYPHT